MMAILTASSGLGTYVPGVQLHRHLTATGRTVGFEVLERLYRTEKLAQLSHARQRFHASFRYALAAQKFLKLQSLAENLCAHKSEGVLRRWQEAGVRRLITFSGFWLPLIAAYRERIGGDLHVDCVLMDAVVSSSWARHFQDYPYTCRLIALYQFADRRVIRTLVPSPAGAAVDRSRRVIAHGGGWQIGNYLEVLAHLAASGYQVLAARRDAIASEAVDGVDYFWLDTSWEPWHSQEATYPWIQWQAGDGASCSSRGESHWLLAQMASSAAIVSKPGGATLLESLMTSTPLVCLDPYGETEEKNGELWCSLGFGLNFDSWRDSGFDEQLLRRARTALLAARNHLPSYGETLDAT